MTVSGIASAENSAGIASGKNCAQNFSASICVAWLNAPDKEVGERAGARLHQPAHGLAPIVGERLMTWCRMSLPRMPAA